MSVFDLARVIIYRFHEKGLEIFLLDPDGTSSDSDIWKLPQGSLTELSSDLSEAIDLEPHTNESGEAIRTLALEGEWHDIPSIRKLIRHDVERVKSKLKEVVPESEKGGFYAVKGTFKKLMPEEYKAVKELKEILIDRNLTKYI